MKVGLIRGAYLSQFEMQTYQHLMPEIELEAYHIRINRFATDIINVPIRHLRCIDDPVTLVSPKLGFYFDLFLQATCGWDYYHFGLVDALADKDIAHTMETFNAFSYQALQAKRRFGTKLAVTVWENRPYAAERFKAKRRMKYDVLREADLFLAMSERARQCLILEGADPRRVIVSPPGIDLDRFHPAETKPAAVMDRLGLDAETFVFISVAALRWEKGVFDLLHAFKRVHNRNPGRPVKLIYAGSGPERNRLEQLAARIGLADRGVFTRFPYDAMHEGYAAADAFILASAPRPGWLEQFGYVLPEAMASGKPMIVTESGSIPEVVGGAGIVVPPCDFMALADAMEHILTDSDARHKLARAARQRAETAYDCRKNAARIGEAYATLTEQD